MALFRCGNGNPAINKFALFSYGYNIDRITMSYDNGSGADGLDIDGFSGTNTTSDLFDINLASNTYTITFKEKCTVTSIHSNSPVGTPPTHFEGDENVGDTLTFPKIGVGALYAWK